ncbi:MAG: redoxin domain-containing protein [Oscillatoriales cyanobacterium RM2_1_1]|nr:redoxin domain-containing protein [Oscillatoriales cyanobacterium SM2_3_0]NJO45067.1 redoxin domain-containing protein [Oscillatoriales cyanobacterium RM2_1_1]
MGVGDYIPNFILPNIEGKLIEAQQLLQENPLFLIFNRGYWHPYDSLKLWNLQNSRPGFLDTKTRPVLICPYVCPELIKIWQKQSANSEFLIDQNLDITRWFGLIQPISPTIASIYQQFGTQKPYPFHHKLELIMNGVYEVNSEGIIIYEYNDLQHTKQFRSTDCLLMQDEDYWLEFV